MYVQPPDRERGREPPQDYAIPKNYSGNAFRRESVPLPEEPPLPEPHEAEQPLEESPEREAPPEVAPAWSPSEDHRPSYGGHGGRDSEDAYRGDDRHERERHRDDREGHRGGFFTRFPFLSSLLPPPRGKNKRGAELPEWALIAAVIFLFFTEDGENDILPFLLLLLLWD